MQVRLQTVELAVCCNCSFSKTNLSLVSSRDVCLLPRAYLVYERNSSGASIVLQFSVELLLEIVILAIFETNGVRKKNIFFYFNNYYFLFKLFFLKFGMLLTTRLHLQKIINNRVSQYRELKVKFVFFLRGQVIDVSTELQ